LRVFSKKLKNNSKKFGRQSAVGQNEGNINIKAIEVFVYLREILVKLLSSPQVIEV
jgi:hypothetical protein